MDSLLSRFRGWLRPAFFGAYLVLALGPDNIGLAQAQTTGTTVGQGVDARGVAVDGAGNRYVADRYNQRIQKFGPNSTANSKGTTVAGTTGIGSGNNELRFPSGVFVDGAGRIFVADMGNHRIQMFAPNSTQGSSGTTVAGGNGNGYTEKHLSYPEGVFVDRAGRIYVADTGNNRIILFGPNSNKDTYGTTVARGFDFGSRNDALRKPTGVFVDEADRIFVADNGNHRIMRFGPNAKFDSEGTIVAGGNGAGFGANQLNNPKGLFVDKAGRILVADTDNDRIQLFAPGSNKDSQGITVAGWTVPRGRGISTNQMLTPKAVLVDGEGRLLVGEHYSIELYSLMPPFAITGVTTNHCELVNANRGKWRVRFTPQYTGLTGQPITLRAGGGVPLTPTNPERGTYTLNLFADRPTVTLLASQSGPAGEVSFTYKWLEACQAKTNAPGRLGVEAEPDVVFRVRVMGNPVQNGQVVVEVEGAVSEPLALTLTDLLGQTLGSHQVGSAGTLERHTFSVGRGAVGMLLLRATTPTQAQTVRVLNAD